jgi:hypothetical protein
MTAMFGALGATKCVGRGARAHGVVGGMTQAAEALSDDLEALKGVPYGGWTTQCEQSRSEASSHPFE